MAKTVFKFYKFNAFPDRFLVHNIRKRGWDLRDKHVEDRELKRKIEEAIVEIKHLSQTGSKRTEDYKNASEKIKQVQKTIKDNFKDLNSNLKTEIKDFEKIDFRGQTFTFRELKDVKKFEQKVKKNIDTLEKKEINAAGKDEEKIKIAKLKYSKAREVISKSLDVLDKKLSSTLKSLWEMAKRQAIGGIETGAILDSENEEKLLRIEKIKAKTVKGLVDEQKSYFKQLNSSKDLESFFNSFQKLMQLYSEEIEAIYIMLKKHRIFVFDLHGKFRMIENFSKQAGFKTKEDDEIESTLKDALSELETLYNWLYHEERRFQKIKLAA